MTTGNTFAPKKETRYVIVGNGAAGAAALREIRSTDPAGRITMLTEEGYDAYSRPLISYYLKGRVPMNKMGYGSPLPPDGRTEVRLSTRVEGIDPEAHTLQLEGGEILPYDKLLLATGSVPFVPPMEGVGGQENVFTFLDLDNAVRIREYARPDMKAVVVGGGLIGMKAAEGLHELCASVTVCELADRILPTILDDRAAGRVRRHVESHGIAVVTGDTVARAESKDNFLRRVVLRSGAVLDCDLLVVAVGVRPNVALARAAGCSVGRGIRTGRDLSTDVPDIWAAGDCTESTDLLDGSSKILALWPNAVAQGRTAGSAMAGGKRTFDGAFAMNAIDFFGLRMVTSGLLQVEEPAYRIEIREDEGSYRRFVVRDNLLRGYCLVGDIDRAGLYTTLIRDDVPLDTLNGDYGAGIGLLAFPAEERRRMLYGDIR